MSDLFQGGKKIIQTLKQAGYEAYFVGGAVRDKFIGRPINDVDIATSATTADVIRLFPKTISVGAEHGTVMVKIGNNFYEVSTFRCKENESPTIRTDLSCRDFTINALAMTEDGGLVDPFQFKNDIDQKIIRAVHSPHERFKEDPLRMLRAIRFVSQLGFTLEAKTKQTISEMYGLLANVAKERITTEFEKILLGREVRKALLLLLETNLYKSISFIESDLMLKKYMRLRLDHLHTLEERWAALFYSSEEKTVPPMYMTKKQKKEIAALLEGLERVSKEGWTSYFLYIYGLEMSKKIRRLEESFVGKTVITETEIEQRYKRLPIQKRSDLAVTPQDLLQFLQKKQGRWLGETMKQIEQLVVEEKLENQKDAIYEFVAKGGRS